MAVAPPPSDAALHARLRSRDRAAWEDVYRLYGDRLYRFAYRLTGNPHDAADLVQETFVRALPRLDRLEPERLDLAAYLLTTEKNLFLKSIEKSKRQIPYESVPEPAEPAPIDDDPERATLLGRQQEEVRRANAGLAPRQRLVLALRELEDRSYAEIGELVGLNENAVAQLISRARQRLREELRLVQVDRSKLPAACQELLPLLSAHLDGQLKGKAAERLLAHLEQCELCPAALSEMREASRRYRALLPFGPELFDRIEDALAATGYWTPRRILRRAIPRRRSSRLALCATVGGLAVAVGAAVTLAGRVPEPAADRAGADTRAPRLSLPERTLVREATSPAGARVAYTATALDGVDGALTPTCTPASDLVFEVGTTRVVCNAHDSAGNTAEDAFQVEVVDTTAPALGLPGPVSVQARGPGGAIVRYRVRVRDSVDLRVEASCSPAAGTEFRLRATEVDCNARDAAGNEVRGSFTVTVTDTLPPELLLPAPLQVEATSAQGARIDYDVSARDRVDGELAPTCSAPPGTVLAVGVTRIACTARDRRGNTARGGFDVTVLDAAAPALRLPASRTVEAAGRAGARVTFAVSASDRGGKLASHCSSRSGALFPIGETTVRCSAADRASGSFTIRVVDTTPPRLRLPRDLRVEAVSKAGSRAGYAATARDRVDGPVGTRCSPTSRYRFRFGVTTVRCTAVDAHGNKASGSFRVVVADTTRPELVLPAALTVEATSPAGAAVEYRASANDRLDGGVATTCSPASGATFPLGTSTVRCTAHDAHGNAVEGSFRVRVVDSTAPALSLPGEIRVQATSGAGAQVTYTATASDAVDGPVAPDCTPSSGSVFAVGSATVTCTARDASGNTTSGAFTVVVTPVPRPDLVVSSVTGTSFTISNVGNAAAGLFVVTVQGLGPFTFSGLAAGASATRTVTCASLQRQVTVDPANQVAESDEQNNKGRLPSC